MRKGVVITDGGDLYGSTVMEITTPFGVASYIYEAIQFEDGDQSAIRAAQAVLDSLSIEEWAEVEAFHLAHYPGASQ